MTDIKLGTKVTAPVTDSEGEPSYVIGTLVSINSRMAGVELSDGSLIKVGKTKIELFAEPEKKIKKQPKADQPKTEDLVRVNPKINGQRYGYVPCIAASGRKSFDKDDSVANMLRGKTLDEAYEIASTILDIPVATLISAYRHLNPGQQRMCLGNKLRGGLTRKTDDVESK